MAIDINTIANDPVIAQRLAEQGVTPADVVTAVVGAHNQIVQAYGLAASAWVQSAHPELLRVAPQDDAHNRQVIEQFIIDGNLPPDPSSYEAAYAAKRDELHLTPNGGGTPPIAFQPSSEVPQLDSASQTVVYTGATEEEFLNAAPGDPRHTERVKQYLEKKYSEPTINQAQFWENQKNRWETNTRTQR